MSREAATIIRDLLKYPYPHDLFAMRQQINDYYEFNNVEENGEKYLEDMMGEPSATGYCTQEFAMAEYDKHKEAVKRAEEYLLDVEKKIKHT